MPDDQFGARDVGIAAFRRHDLAVNVMSDGGKLDRAVPIGTRHPFLQVPGDSEGRVISENRTTSRRIGFLRFPMTDLALDGDSSETTQVIDAAHGLDRLPDQIHRPGILRAGGPQAHTADQQGDGANDRRTHSSASFRNRNHRNHRPLVGLSTDFSEFQAV